MFFFCLLRNNNVRSDRSEKKAILFLYSFCLWLFLGNIFNFVTPSKMYTLKHQGRQFGDAIQSPPSLITFLYDQILTLDGLCTYTSPRLFYQTFPNWSIVFSFYDAKLPSIPPLLPRRVREQTLRRTAAMYYWVNYLSCCTNKTNGPVFTHCIICDENVARLSTNKLELHRDSSISLAGQSCSLWKVRANSAAV